MLDAKSTTNNGLVSTSVDNAAYLADQALRDDPVLRVSLVKLIPQLRELLEEAGAEVARLKDEKSDIFAADKYGSLLLWLAMEFFTQAEFDAENRQSNLHFSQLDADHAAAYFDAELSKSHHSDHETVINADGFTIKALL